MKLKKTCDKAEENLHVWNDDKYREMNLYDWTAALSALQGLPKVLDAHDPKGVVMNIQGGPEKGPYFVFHHKVVFYNFFPYFSGDVDSRPGRVFDNNMDLTGRYTTR